MVETPCAGTGCTSVFDSLTVLLSENNPEYRVQTRLPITATQRVENMQANLMTIQKNQESILSRLRKNGEISCEEFEILSLRI